MTLVNNPGAWEQTAYDRDALVNLALIPGNTAEVRILVNGKVYGSVMIGALDREAYLRLDRVSLHGQMYRRTLAFTRVADGQC